MSELPHDPRGCPTCRDITRKERAIDRWESAVALLAGFGVIAVAIVFVMTAP